MALGQGAPAHAQTPTEALPDLVADAPRWPVFEQYTSGGETRLLLRFDGFIHNVGAGAADMRGSARDGLNMTSVSQRVHRTDGTWTDEPRPGATIRYEEEDGHSHWHLGEAARYSLWNYEQTAEVAPAMKVGFCFEDTERIETHGPDAEVYSDDAVRFCEQHDPNVAGVWMGISAGWRDIYDSWLAFQWVDVSNVAPGAYRLHAEVDPHDVVRESDESNAVGVPDGPTIVPGYRAEAVTVQGLTAGAPAALTLRAVTWGDPGARQFRVDSAPAHGTLNVAVGEWFTGPGLTYTPDAGYDGTDSFSFSARDSSSAYPRTPVVATVAVGVERPAETVAISGAPSQLYTGTGAQLTAVVANGPGQVTWSVSGVPGGSSTLGTITVGGLYSAPASVPPGERVTIRATGSSGAYAEVAVTVAASPVAPPSPGPVTPDPGKPAPVLPPLLSVPTVSLRGRTIYLSTVPGRTGTIETSAMIGKRRVALCRTRAPARRRVTCKLAISRRYKPTSVRLIVKLLSGRKTIATRTARVPRR